MKLYQEIANDIEKAIRSGVLQQGTRLPTVRQLRDERNVSASTVFRAYYLLEAKRLIQARDRSGYYVVFEGAGGIAAPAALSSRPEPDQDTPGAVLLDLLACADDHDTVPLGARTPSHQLFPAQRLRRALSASFVTPNRFNHYSGGGRGNVELRRQIALRYLSSGMQVDPDDIVITSGACEALSLAALAMARPGDAIAIESPTAPAIRHGIERLGLRAIDVPASAPGGIDLAALKLAVLTQRPAACMLMPTFQHPLGALMADDTKRELVQFLRHHTVPLIENDVCQELYFGRVRPLPAKAWDADGLVLHCSSFSKTLAPDYCVGWVVPGRFMPEVLRHQSLSGAQVPDLLQRALANYLAKGGYEVHLRKLRRLLAEQCETLSQEVLTHFPAGTRVQRPQGGYFLWVELPPACSAMALYRQARQMQISVAPGPIFSACGEFSHCLQLNFGQLWDARTAQAVHTLGRLATRQLAGMDLNAA
jgi:DNA-binding transcriptional MocR family regulator